MAIRSIAENATLLEISLDDVMSCFVEILIG